MEVELTKPQSQMFQMECKFPLFVAGYGTGKTFSLLINSLRDALTVPGARVGSYCPTYDLLKLNIIPRTEELLNEVGIKYSINKSDHIFKFANKSEIIMRSMDNPARIIAYEVFRSHVDEIDTIPKDKADDIWRKILARNRQKIEIVNPCQRKLEESVYVEDSEGRFFHKNMVSVYTTPDHGFNSFTYSRWGSENRSQDYQFIRAPTSSNPHLPEDYEQTIRDSYTSELAEAYLSGMWCNLTSGIVYHKYDPKVHNSTETIKPNEPLFIGMDFNVQHMAATVYVQRQNGWHAVSELKELMDTPDMIQAIKDRWHNDRVKHRIIIYPDATGNSRKSVDATRADIAQLRQARFEVRARNTNPPVKDRITSVNRQFERGNLWINAKECPTVSKCLQQQAYDSNGLPDKKSGFDHQNDATGYPIAYEFPIIRPVSSGRTAGLA